MIEEAFESPTATVEVRAGGTTTVDIALAALGAGPEQGAAARGASAQRNYGGGAADGRAAEIVDFDTLYPPHPARDVMLRSCFGCHGPAGFHRRGPRNENGVAAGGRPDVRRGRPRGQHVPGRAPGDARPGVGRREGADHPVPDRQLRTRVAAPRPRARPARPRRGDAVQGGLHRIRDEARAAAACSRTARRRAAASTASSRALPSRGSSGCPATARTPSSASTAGTPTSRRARGSCGSRTPTTSTSRRTASSNTGGACTGSSSPATTSANSIPPPAR